MEDENFIESKAERVKLTKNTKGYNWEVSLNGSGDNGKLLLDDLTRLKNFDNKLKEQYGEQVE